MITQNELYDLSFVISLIRSDITANENITILNIILDLLNNKEQSISNNEIRKNLRQIPILSKKWEFVYHENYYVRTIVFKNDKIIKVMSDMLMKLKSLLLSQEYAQAYDLADALHTLPEIIADNKGKIPHKYSKIFLNSYRNKWDNIHKK